MTFLEELKKISEKCEIPVETGVFSDTAPDVYIVVTPLNDDLEYYADDMPQRITNSARLSLFSKGNYVLTANRLVKELLMADFYIVDMGYIGHEDNTGYHHYAVDTEKNYKFETEE